ncbi:Uma2 family endonuclease [Rubrobacter taiwanensis]|nr:Uma2 family endonuclease [Rubrobacter taiwanensis]
MAEKATPHGPLSIEEYRKLEESATVRHEYVAGEIYAMVGATRRHHRICGNIFRRLADAAAGGPCRVSMETVRLEVAGDVIPGGIAYYPDVMVVCGREPEDPYIEDAPCLVVEVVSPNTASTDRREKLMVYRQIPSVEAYLIIEQDRKRVERHFRGEDGLWRKADLVDVGRFPVPCPPDTELTLDEVYEGL